MVEKEEGNTKIRWERIYMTVDLDGKIMVDKDTEKTDALLLEENKYRETYNQEENSLSFQKLRATDVKNNPRIHMGEPRPAK